MLKFIDTGDGFVMTYPIWIGLIVVVGLVMGWYAARRKDMAWRNRLTLFVGSLGFIVTGLYFVTYKAAITPESGRVYGFLLRNDTIDWTDASGVAVEARAGKGGPNYFLVVARRSGERFEMPFYGLPAAERERVVAFVAAKIKR